MYDQPLTGNEPDAATSRSLLLTSVMSNADALQNEVEEFLGWRLDKSRLDTGTEPEVRH